VSDNITYYSIFNQSLHHLGFIGLSFQKHESNAVLTKRKKLILLIRKMLSICIVIYEFFMISLSISYLFKSRNKNIQSNNIDYEMLKVGNVMHFILPKRNSIIIFVLVAISLPIANWFLFNFNRSFDIHRMPVFMYLRGEIKRCKSIGINKKNSVKLKVYFKSCMKYTRILTSVISVIFCFGVFTVVYLQMELVTLEIFGLIFFWSLVYTVIGRIAFLNILIQTIICYFITEH